METLSRMGIQIRMSEFFQWIGRNWKEIISYILYVALVSRFNLEDQSSFTNFPFQNVIIIGLYIWGQAIYVPELLLQ